LAGSKSGPCVIEIGIGMRRTSSEFGSFAGWREGRLNTARQNRVPRYIKPSEGGGTQPAGVHHLILPLTAVLAVAVLERLLGF
jgi:hypothetical protein